MISACSVGVFTLISLILVLRRGKHPSRIIIGCVMMALVASVACIWCSFSTQLQLNEKEKTITTLQALNTEKQQEIERKNHQVAWAEETRDKALKDFPTLRQELDQKKAELIKAEAIIPVLRKTNDRLTQEMEGINEEIRKQTMGDRWYVDELNSFASKLKEKDAKIEALESRLKRKAQGE